MADQEFVSSTFKGAPYWKKEFIIVDIFYRHRHCHRHPNSDCHYYPQRHNPHLLRGSPQHQGIHYHCDRHRHFHLICHRQVVIFIVILIAIVTLIANVIVILIVIFSVILIVIVTS